MLRKTGCLGVLLQWDLFNKSELLSGFFHLVTGHNCFLGPYFPLLLSHSDATMVGGMDLTAAYP